MLTRIGDGNLLMNYSHIAHDCLLGNHNIVANGAQLGRPRDDRGLRRRSARWSASTSS